jgi:hypothetical protein
MTEGKLTDEMRRVVVQSLACFEDPSAVAAEVAREFGVEITRQSIEGYDPTKRAGSKLSPKWRALFEETRRAFLTDSAAIGISHKVVRLREIERLIGKAETAGDLQLVGRLLEQAARECGDAYTNRHRIAVKTTEDPTVAARRQELLEKISATMDKVRERERRAEDVIRRARERGIEI